MKADIKLGICISNDDPKNLGRIRAIPVNVLGKLATLQDILNFIENEDRVALNSLTYNPWNNNIIGNFKEADKYLCEPFLPKILGITPLSGQLVKMVTYDDLSQKQEFLGPFTIDQISVNEEYRSVLNNLEKNVNLIEVLPNKNKTFISGYSGEQLIMGNNEFILRLNHINQSNKTRKNLYPFVQLSQYPNSFEIKDRTVDIVNTPDIPIDHICEIFISYQPKSNITDKNFSANIILYDASKQINSRSEIGLTRTTYQKTKNYINLSYQDFIVKHFVNSSDFNEFYKTIDDIVSSYSNNGRVKYFDPKIGILTQRIDGDKTTIITYNNISNIPNLGGGVNNPEFVTGIRNWILRLSPGTNITNFNGSLIRPNLPPQNIQSIRYQDFFNLDFLIQRFSTERLFGNLLIQNQTVTTQIVPTPEPTNRPQSVYTTYSDKVLLLSSLTSPNIVDDFNSDGITSEKIAEYLNSSNKNVKTYGIVRGEKLMELLDEILNVFLRHGHESLKDPRTSLIQSTVESVENIRKKIKDEFKNGRNNVIINHNLRLN